MTEGKVGSPADVADPLLDPLLSAEPELPVDPDPDPLLPDGEPEPLPVGTVPDPLPV